jgi:hypothetical protein
MNLDRIIFFNALDRATTADELIYIIRNTDYDLRSKEGQPDRILQRFTNLTPEKAIEVVAAFRQRFGSIVICRNGSYYLNRPLTIMDIILIDRIYTNESINSLSIQSMDLLYGAFAVAGFKHAAGCDNSDLYYEYCLDPSYATSANRMIHMWDPDMISIHNKKLIFHVPK